MSEDERYFKHINSLQEQIAELEKKLNKTIQHTTTHIELQLMLNEDKQKRIEKLEKTKAGLDYTENIGRRLEQLENDIGKCNNTATFQKIQKELSELKLEIGILDAKSRRGIERDNNHEEVLREIRLGIISILQDAKAHQGLRLHENIFLETLLNLDGDKSVSGDGTGQSNLQNTRHGGVIITESQPSSYCPNCGSLVAIDLLSLEGDYCVACANKKPSSIDDPIAKHLTEKWREIFKKPSEQEITDPLAKHITEKWKEVAENIVMHDGIVCKSCTEWFFGEKCIKDTIPVEKEDLELIRYNNRNPKDMIIDKIIKKYLAEDKS